jgi:hypothetical protein
MCQDARSSSHLDQHSFLSRTHILSKIGSQVRTVQVHNSRSKYEEEEQVPTTIEGKIEQLESTILQENLKAAQFRKAGMEDDGTRWLRFEVNAAAQECLFISKILSKELQGLRVSDLAWQ